MTGKFEVWQDRFDQMGLKPAAWPPTSTSCSDRMREPQVHLFPFVPGCRIRVATASDDSPTSPLSTPT